MGTDLVPAADAAALTTITCQGRALDHTTGQSTGTVCGQTIRQRPNVPANLLDTARAAGWRIGTRTDGTPPDAMCPRCARPDPTTTALLRDLTRSVQP